MGLFDDVPDLKQPGSSTGLFDDVPNVGVPSGGLFDDVPDVRQPETPVRKRTSIEILQDSNPNPIKVEPVVIPVPPVKNPEQEAAIDARIDEMVQRAATPSISLEEVIAKIPDEKARADMLANLQKFKEFQTQPKPEDEAERNRAGRLAEFEQDNALSGYVRGAKFFGKLLLGSIFDVSANDEDKGRDVLAAINEPTSEPLPRQKELAQEKGVLSAVKRGLASVVETAPVIVAGAPAGPYVGIPAAFATDTYQQTGSVGQAAKAGVIALAFPFVSKFLTPVGVAVNKRLIKTGVIDAGNATAQKAVEATIKQAGFQAFAQLTALPEYVKMTPEQRRDAIIESTVANTVFALPDAVAVFRPGVPSDTQVAIKNELRTQMDAAGKEADVLGQQSTVAKVPGVKPEDVGLPEREAGKPAVQEAAGTRSPEAETKPRLDEAWADSILSVDPRTQSQIGLDPRAEARRLAAVAVKGAAMFQRGVTKFADWSVEMLKTVGEWVRPFLTSTWERITGKDWNAELKALSDTLYTHTPEDVATMREAQNVIGQSPTARRIFNELSQTEEGKAVLNSVQFRQLRESVASLDERHVNYLTLRDNPDVHPSVKSNARRMALKQIEAFDDAYQAFKDGYETRKATLESEAKDLGQRGTVASTKADIAGAVLSYLRTRGRRQLRDAQESARLAVKAAVGDAKRTVETQAQEAEAAAALKAVDATLGNDTATRKALEYIARNLDFSLLDPATGRILNSQELVNHLRGNADWADFAQAVGAPRDVIENVARVVRASEPLRQQLMEAKELAGGEKPFAELQAELRATLSGKDIRKAMDIMARGVGKTAAEKALSARLAKLLLAKESRLLNKLRTLEDTKTALDAIATSGDYRNIRDTVLADTGVSQVLHTTEGTDYVLNPVTKGGTVYKISMAPDGSVARKGLEDYQKWRDEVLEYLSDPDAEWFSMARAKNLEDALNETSFLGNPANQPEAGIFVFSAIQKLTAPLSRVIAYWDKVPRLTIGRLVGFPAELVGRQLTAWETAGKAQQMVNASHLKVIHQARKQALKVQGFGHTESELKRYGEMVFNPLVESYQSFDVTPLKAGDSLRNGYTVKGSDIAYFKAVSAWERAVQKQLEGKAEDAFSILQQQPLKVIYKTKGGEQRTRERLETGPRTAGGDPKWAYGRAKNWHEKPAEAKEAWLDKHLFSIVQSYVRGVAENNFLNNSKISPELETVWNGMTDRPLESFADLVARVEEQLPLREGTETIDARAQMMAEIGGLFDRVDKAGKVVEGKIQQATLNKSRVNVESWASEFNTARGQRIMPAGWYKYSALTSADQASFLARGLRPFEYAYLETLEAVLKSMKEMDQQLKEENTGHIAAWREGRDKQLAGTDFYTPGQLRSVLKEVAHHVDEVKAAIETQEKYAFTVDETGAAVQGASANYLTASLLSGSTWNLNLVGATAAETGFDRTVRGFYTAKAAAKNLGMAHWSLLAREGLYRTGLGNPNMQKFLRNPAVRVFTANVSKLMADSAARTKEAYGDTRRGGAMQRADMIDMLQYMYELRYSGGKPGPVSSSRFVRGVNAGIAFPARAVAATATHLLAITDANRNVSLYQRAKEMAADAETRALKFGGLRMESGLDPFDANGRVDLTKPENRFSDKELLGREGIDDKLASTTPEDARRHRDFWAKQAGMDIDGLMWDFVKRHEEAVAKEKAEGVAEGTYSDKVRMMTDAQVRQLGLGIAAYGNLSTVGNRPMRSHQIKNLLLPFLAYPAYWVRLLETYSQNLSTRTVLRGRAGSIPMLIGIAAVLSVFGAVGMAESDLFKRFFMGKHTQAPTLLNAQNPAEVARALVAGFGSVVPFYGSIANNISGTGARNGFDVNSQFLALNFATDMMKTAREIYMTGDASYPAYRLAERYAFPANYLARLLPGYSGLKEQTNERADVRVAARNAGLEALLRKPGGVPDLPDYGPATPILREWDNAVGNRDMAGAQAAYQKLVAMEAQTGSPNPEASALQKVRRRTPLNSVLHRQPTEPELAQLLAAMPANDRAKVQTGMQFVDSAIQGLGGNPVAFAKAERSTRGSFSGGGFGGSNRRFGRTRRVGRGGRRAGPGRRVRAGRTRRAPGFRRRR